MADRAIGELERAQNLSEDALIPLEQQGKAMSLSGKQFADFAREAGAADVQRAVDAANDAELSAQGAKTDADRAEAARESIAVDEAKLAQAVENAEQSEADAKAAQLAAEKARDDAQAIAGGDFVFRNEIGAPGGVATLDDSGKVPSAQLPEMDCAARNLSNVSDEDMLEKIQASGFVGGSNRNILDNAYWENPASIVDQRGGYVVPPNVRYFVIGGNDVEAGVTDKYYKVEGYTAGGSAIITVGGTQYAVGKTAMKRGYTGTGYTIDRWRLSAVTITALVESSGVRLVESGSTDAARPWLNHIFENSDEFAGKTVTFSALVTANTASKFRLTLRDANSTTGVYKVKDNTLSVGETALVTYSTSLTHGLKFCALQLFSNGADVTVHAAELELGTRQTLAQQENGVWVLNEIPNYAEELAKCQRQLPVALFVSSGSRMASGTFVAISETEALGTIETPVSPRANGAAVFNEMYLYRNGRFAISKFNYLNANGSGFYASVTSTGLTVGNVYKLMTGTSGGSLLISCEL